MRSLSATSLVATVAVAGLLGGCTASDDPGDAADPVASPPAASPPAGESPGEPDGTGEASPDQTLVLSECGTVRARPGDARRTEYLGDPVVARVGRGEDYDLGGASPAPTTRVGAAVTAPRGAVGGVEIAPGLERRIARAAGVQVGPQVGAAEEGPGNSFTNEGPAQDLAIVDYVMYRVARWSADDCLAFPGETVRGTLTYDMIPGDAVLSCDPRERRPDDPFESTLLAICPG